jgi:hypothetical protein
MTDWSAYPESWPTAQRATLPKGVAKLDDGIRESAQRRVTQIRKDLNNAGPHYPRDEVRKALAFWHIKI